MAARATRWQGAVQNDAGPIFIVRFNYKKDDHVSPPANTEEIRRIIRSHGDAYRDCYELYLRRTAPRAPSVKVMARIVVADRKVYKVTLDWGGVAGEPLESCMLGALRRLDFSSLSKDAVIVPYPLSLVPQR